jgi:hypothetical protein
MSLEQPVKTLRTSKLGTCVGDSVNVRRVTNLELLNCCKGLEGRTASWNTYTLFRRGGGNFLYVKRRWGKSCYKEYS